MYIQFLTAASTAIILLSKLSTSYIIPSSNINTLSKRATPNPLTQLLSIVPSASTCASATYSSECSTASAALSPIISSFSQYGIVAAAEQAALLSWMAYESGEFKYNANHFPAPGNPGQGTRTMMSPAFVAQYVASIPALASQASGKDAAGLLALVQPDEYSFGSAAWFYSTHCSESVKEAVRTGSKSGWEGFLTGCVSTTVDEGSGDKSREAYWNRAMAALYVTPS